MADHNSWEKKEDLENVRELVNEFKRELSVEVKR